MAPADRLTVATYNVHGGVDGWGRPFDLAGDVARLAADVVVLQEAWTPAGGTGDAVAVGQALGYEVAEQVLGHGRRAGPHPGADSRWMRPLAWRPNRHALYVDSERPVPPKVARSQRYQTAERGSWGVAVLSRRPLSDRRTLDLGRLPLDPARRLALAVTLDTGAGPLLVVGAHMSHLSSGSPVQFRRLRRQVLDLGPGPSLVVGDMNLWGPPLVALMTGWHRGVVGRSWPAWRPHSQLDHILVRPGAGPPVRVEEAGVVRGTGSDHLPVRARLALGGSAG
jgi:endonuclease/exonuclease/phosphatase family metal-dependent hydrolase